MQRIARVVVARAVIIGLPLGLISMNGRVALAVELPVLHYDLETGAFDGILPHRTDFLVKVEVPRSYNRVTLSYWQHEGRTCGPPPTDSTLATAWGVNRDALADTAEVRTVTVKMPPLEFSQSYCFAAQLGREWSPADAQALVHGINAVLATLEATGKLDLGAGGKNEVLAAIRAQIRDSRRLEVVAGPGRPPQPLDEYLMNWLVGKLTGGGLGNSYEDVRSALNNVKMRASQLEFDAAATELATKATTGPASNVSDATRTTIQSKLDELRGAMSRLPATAFTPSAMAKDSKALDALQVSAQQFIDATAATCAATKALEKTCSTRLAAENLARNITDASTKQAKLATALATLQLDTINLADALRTSATDAPASAARSGVPSYTDRSAFYIAGDVGAVVPLFFHDQADNPNADYALFVGASFYFVPVDKSKPLAAESSGWHRFSVTAGVTLNDVKDPSRSAKGALGGKGGMIGIGLRVTDYLRVGTGLMLIRQKNSNPLSDQDSVKATPYVSASIDVDVVGTVSGFFKKPAQL